MIFNATISDLRSECDMANGVGLRVKVWVRRGKRSRPACDFRRQMRP